MIKLTQDTRPDDVVEFEKPTELGDVRRASYSALKVYEECLTEHISAVSKALKSLVAQLQTAVRKSINTLKTTSTALKAKMHDSLLKFKDDFEELRQLYAEAKVELEGEWGFDLDWAPVGWMQKETWHASSSMH